MKNNKSLHLVDEVYSGIELIKFKIVVYGILFEIQNTMTDSLYPIERKAEPTNIWL